jgi:3-oxoacyl-[acyl-carrier-protein] synthase I
MQKRVFVTGFGIICAIGDTEESIIRAFRSGKGGIGQITRTSTIHKGQIPAAEVPYSDTELLEKAAYCGKLPPTRTALLGMCAASDAMKYAAWSANDGKSGLISATSVGGMDKTEGFYRQYHQNSSKGRLRDVVGHDCGDSTEKIAQRIGIKDFISTISTACSSSVNSVMYAARLIRHGVLDAALAGGTDALAGFTINGFNTLMILDRQPCRPFDESRAGLNLGEGAAYLFIESEESLRRRGVKAICEIKGFGNANDAYHQTASSPDGNGAWLAMSAALKSADLSPSDISYVNVHGTGTQNNDLSEGIAMKRVFGDKIPPFSSTKPFTGHTLGAAGGIESVFSALSIKYGMIYPNLNFSAPITELGLTPALKLSEGIKIRNVLSNSFGFGGNNSSIILSAC